MSGFSTLPTGCSTIDGSFSANLAPQPPFLEKQIQPPPYSALPLIMASALHFGHFLLAWRYRNLDSSVEHDPTPWPAKRPVGTCTSSHRTSYSRWPSSRS